MAKNDTQPTGADYASQAGLRRGYQAEIRDVAAELRKPVHQAAADRYAHSKEHRHGSAR